ncbi:MAG: hypothetical protein RMJ19_10260 [Gemmatales bacterium]|nr:hypothetical protein [Gemmatales bacterium]MDW8176043.1 hypothetical protein [Gemmatales bacterium]
MNHHRALYLETLEERLAPAGNVNVFITGGVLTILGDNDGNRIRITQRAAFNLLISPGDASTTINGGSAAVSLITRGVHRVVVDLKGGNDVLEISPGGGIVVFNAPVFINTGSGSDSVLIEDIVARNHFTIDTGNQGDQVILRSPSRPLQLNRDLTILTGQGPDALTALNVVLRGSLRFATGQQNDQVRLQNVVVGGEFNANLGEGADFLALNQTEVRGQAFLGGNAGSDEIIITHGQFDFSLRIATSQAPSFFSSDNDFVNVCNTYVAGDVIVSTGKGSDFVRLRYNFFEAQIFVHVGENNDSLEFVANDFELGMVAQGGLGLDTFVDLGSNSGLVKLESFP